MPSTPPEAVLKPKALRNVRNVVLGNTLFPTWYPSFYPEELIGRDVDKLYVCQWCFKYATELKLYAAHAASCTSRANGPSGKSIYDDGRYMIYEVDGLEDKLFTQNLSLFAKLFLDNKSVFFDVSSFNYYLLVQKELESLGQGLASSFSIVGFFSKEKISWDSNNLACILVFPPWQRQGLGQILMGVSYSLSRRDDKIGGPEKPLSELGRKGYQRFWEARIGRVMLGLRGKSSLTVEELAKQCWMLPEDVIGALKGMGICEVRKKGDGVGVAKSRIKEWADKERIDLKDPVDDSHFLIPWNQQSIDE